MATTVGTNTHRRRPAGRHARRRTRRPFRALTVLAAVVALIAATFGAVSANADAPELHEFYGVTLAPVPSTDPVVGKIGGSLVVGKLSRGPIAKGC